MRATRRYKRVADMERDINRYIAECQPEYLTDKDSEIRTDKSGNPIILRYRRPTMAGLTLALGFGSRQSLHDYMQRYDADERPYVDAILRAKTIIEDATLQAAFERDSSRGACFVLQNGFGYRENKGVELTDNSSQRVIRVKLEDDPGDA